MSKEATEDSKEALSNFLRQVEKPFSLFFEPLSENFAFMFAKESDFKATTISYKKWYLEIEKLPVKAEDFECIAGILRAHPKAEAVFGNDNELYLEEWDVRDLAESELKEQEEILKRFLKWKESDSGNMITGNRFCYGPNPPLIKDDET